MASNATEESAAQPTEAAPQNPENNPALDWFNSYFDGRHSHRFNGFAQSNDNEHDYYDARFNPGSAVTRASVAVEWAAFSEIAQDANMIYIPCGISSGLRAHEELDKQNSSNRPLGKPVKLSTYKLDGYIGADVHRDNVIVPNRNDNLSRARIVGRLHPDSMIIPPVAREGAVRALKDQAFLGGRRYEEEDFMALWYPVIDRCKGMCLDGDWNFSRNSIWEMMRGVLIQAGQIPSRPDADMEVFDLEGKPVTLLARAKKVAEALQYQLGKGLEAREAATALAQIFTLDDEIRSGTLPSDRIHASLRNENRASEFEAMDALRKEFKPLILEHCAHYMRLDNLPQEYKDAAKVDPEHPVDAAVNMFKDFADNISEHASQILSIFSSSNLRRKLPKNEPPQRLFDSYERFFEKGSRAKMFEDDLYGKLDEWERLALPFAIGATETGLYPKKQPMATMVLTDLKRGKIGFERAQAAGVDNMDEFAGTEGREIEEVKAANTSQAEELKAKLKAENPGKIVVNTPSFLRIADVIDKERHEGFVAAPGASKTSPQMRLALQMKYLDRNVDNAVFQEGWEHSNDLVQLRVRARLIQAGLVERPAGAQSALHVCSANDPETPETLFTDIKLLTAEVKRCADANVDAPEQALALARLVALHDLVTYPTLQDTPFKTTRMLINPQSADESLTSYDPDITPNGLEDAKLLIEEAKKLLKEKASLWIPDERLQVSEPDELESRRDPNEAAARSIQNRLMQDYVHDRDKLQGEEWRRKARASANTSQTVVTQEGAVR